MVCITGDLLLCISFFFSSSSGSRGGGRRRRFDGEDFGPRLKRLRGQPNFRGRTEKPGNV